MPDILQHPKKLVWVKDFLYEGQTLLMNFLKNKKVIDKGLHKSELTLDQVAIALCLNHARVGCCDRQQGASNLVYEPNETFEG